MFCYFRTLCLWSYLTMVGLDSVNISLVKCCWFLFVAATKSQHAHFCRFIWAWWADMWSTYAPSCSGTVISGGHQRKEMDHRLVAKQLCKLYNPTQVTFCAFREGWISSPSGWICNSLSTACQTHNAATCPCAPVSIAAILNSWCSVSLHQVPFHFLPITAPFFCIQSFDIGDPGGMATSRPGHSLE